jgi:hypothetical protein
MVTMLIYSTTTKYEYKYYTGSANPDANIESLKRQNLISFVFGKSKLGDYQGESVSFFYPFDSTRTPGTGSSASYYKGHDSLYSLKGKTYYSVRKFYLENDNTWDRWSVNYYWAKGIGLIRKENTSKNESWELINFNIIIP